MVRKIPRKSHATSRIGAKEKSFLSWMSLGVRYHEQRAAPAMTTSRQGLGRKIAPRMTTSGARFPIPSTEKRSSPASS